MTITKVEKLGSEDKMGIKDLVCLISTLNEEIMFDNAIIGKNETGIYFLKKQGNDNVRWEKMDNIISYYGLPVCLSSGHTSLLESYLWAMNELYVIDDLFDILKLLERLIMETHRRD